MFRRTLFVFLVILAFPCAATETSETTGTLPGAPTLRTDSLAPPKTFTATLTGTFNGTKLAYSATAGETYLKNDQGEYVQSIFSVSYVRKDAKNIPDRPVVFLFNGGPGTSSVFLHIGFLGPKRVQVPALRGTGNPPFHLVDNAESLLDACDLVFIDPPGTGFSRAIGAGKPGDAWGIKEDAQAVSEFIGRWLTQNQRWNSPRYLLGESYGTTRAVAIVDELGHRFTGVNVNGVILLSAALDFDRMIVSPGNDAPFVSFLPTYAATALYHGKISPAPAEAAHFLNEVRDFAVNEYSVALLKGTWLTATERANFAAKLAHYTGLSVDYVQRADLRVTPERFRKELLRDRALTLGQLDARYVGQDADSAGELTESDASSTSIENAYLSTFNDYLTRVLGVDLGRRYKGYAPEVWANWKWVDPHNVATHINLAPILGKAMRTNPDFRVFLGSGSYDLSTPIFASELTLAHNGIRANQITAKEYGSGHMLYTDEHVRTALLADLRVFLGKP